MYKSKYIPIYVLNSSRLHLAGEKLLVYIYMYMYMYVTLQSYGGLFKHYYSGHMYMYMYIHMIVRRFQIYGF